MPSFRRGDIVRVPFPYTDGRTTQHRPALVVSDGGVGDGGLLIWVVMITSARNRPWAGDVSIGDGYEAGNTAPVHLCGVAGLQCLDRMEANDAGFSRGDDGACGQGLSRSRCARPGDEAPFRISMVGATGIEPVTPPV